MNQRNMLVWEPLYKGHYAFFLELVVRALEQAGWTVTVATDADSPVCLSKTVFRISTDPQANPSAEPFQIAHKLGITNIFICHLDSVLLPWKNLRFIGPEESPVHIHGIWIQASGALKTGLLNYLSQRSVRRSRLFIQRLKSLFDRNMLGEVFVLDERLSQQQVALGFPATLLPDPWRSAPKETRAESRTLLGLPQDRVIFLHIGSDEKRKGLLDVLKLVSKFPSSGPFIVRAGELKPRNTGKRVKLIQRLTLENRLLCANRAVSEEAFDLYLRAADYVLLPYRSHDDSSGILSRAIGAGTPVIASDFGLIGKRVRALNLGILYRNNNMRDLRRAMSTAWQTPASHFPVGHAADTFSPEHFIGLIRAHFEGMKA
jgi:glycosyltransferase involved in cell wall biosynthesis